MGDVVWTQNSTNNWDLIYNTGQLPPIAPRGGSWLAWLGGDDSETAILSQTITISADRPILNYWFDSGSIDASCIADYFSVKVGSTVIIFEPVCTINATNGWVHRTLDLTSFGGSEQDIQFMVMTNSTNSSSVILDDISLEATNSLTRSGTIVSGERVSSPISSSDFRKDRIVE